MRPAAVLPWEAEWTASHAMVKAIRRGSPPRRARIKACDCQAAPSITSTRLIPSANERAMSIRSSSSGRNFAGVAPLKPEASE